jgi:acid stress-induced BolA-like protein IbaG/YrbA
MEYVLKMMITVLNINILTQQGDGLQFGVVAVKKYVNLVNLDFILILQINV